MTLLQRLTASGPTWLTIGLLGNVSPWLSRALDGPVELVGLIDLGTHWQFVWHALTLIGLGLIGVHRGIRRLPVPGLLTLGGALLATAAIQPAALPHAQDSRGPHLTIASANLLYGSANLPLLRTWLSQINADLIVLQEVTPGAAVQLASWDEYPYRAMVPQDDGFGIAVLSRNPKAHTTWGVSFGSPYAAVTTQLGTHPFTFYGIHPPPPAKPSWHVLRNSLLSHLREEALKGSTIVAGDFNATPWSAALPSDGLLRATSLAPTWQGMLPIDHVMATADWRVLDSGRGPDTGSDHRPVWARLALANP